MGGVQKYWYDANGNVMQRIGEDGATYEFGYDFENRVTQLKKNGAVISAFKYDRDGNRILETTSGVTTGYLSNTYEWTSVGPALRASAFQTSSAPLRSCLARSPVGPAHAIILGRTAHLSLDLTSVFLPITFLPRRSYHA